jgi:very-short-patch-repair endonuclease
MAQAASPSSALRAPSPTRGEGKGADAPADVWGPSPLMGEGGRRPDEGVTRIARARALRQSQTETEARMWSVLRDRRLRGFKFRRQVPIGRYVADLATYKAKLVIELDGSQHIDSQRDVFRDAELRERGFEVIRFWNTDALKHRASVLTLILDAIHKRTGNPNALG